MIIFPVNTNFLGAVFPTSGLPNLPGRGNTLELVKPPADLRGVLSGLNLPPVIAAQLQGLDPAKQKEVILQFVRRAQLHRQQHQHQHQQIPSQPTQVLPAQEMGTMGMPNVNVSAAGNMGMNNFPVSASTSENSTCRTDYLSLMHRERQDPWPVSMVMVAGQ